MPSEPNAAQGSTPARPHRRFTEDGRRIREVLTYSRRGSRLTDPQADVWRRRSGDWWVPDDVVDRPGPDLADWFGREAPLVVEIGSGVGEATAELAAARPSYNVLAFEVWRPGVAATFQRLERLGVENVRLASVDAVWSFEHLLEADSIAEIWTFFPDPWPKKRHHKRRLVTPEFARLAGSRLAPGATWRLATDWAHYAAQMRGVLDGVPGLAGGVVERWADRPVTRFERKGIASGRAITDLLYQRL